jgi:general secretion pathway protein M
MAKIEKTPAMALGALLLLLLCCAISVGGTLSMRAVAVHELREKRELLSSFELRARSREGVPATAATAPPSAYIAAPTQGLANARLQAYLSQLIAAQHGALLSAGAQPPGVGDGEDTIRVLATADISSNALQGLLHRLETDIPYVFVDALTVQPTPAGGQRSEDLPLRVSLTVHALWRRAQA